MYQHLYELLLDRAAKCPDAVALGGERGLGWETLTSTGLLRSADLLAAELAAIGVREGDRVVLWTPNHPRSVVYIFALWRLGAIPVPFDRDTNNDAANRIVDAVEPRAIIVGYEERGDWTKERTLTGWWEPGSAAPVSPNASPVDFVRPSEELAVISFTSGTTGNPKGCMITHRNLCSQVDALSVPMHLDPSCRLASILPLSHLFELVCGLLFPLAQGASIHYIPSRRAPDILRVLTERKITHMNLVPQVLSLMGNALEEQLRTVLKGPLYGVAMAAAGRLSLGARRKLFWPVHRRLGEHLWFMASGGAALAPELQLFWERLGMRIVQGYGTSECSPVVACGLDDGSTPVGSVGRALKDVEVRIDPQGELLVRGPNVMRGYWKDPERTADTIKDGWYYTGDLASIDPQGNIHLAGRAKDLIVLSSGMNVWPQDVEDALRTDAAIKDAAVIAVSTPTGGTTLHAYLIPATEAGRAMSLTAIVSRCNGRLAQHQRVATASWWPDADFPRTTTMKVRRMLLPAPDRTGITTIDSVLAADDPVGQAISAVARVPSVRGDHTLGQLGLDSLSIAQLAVALEEKTGRFVADGDLSLDLTVEEIRAKVAVAPEAGEGYEGLAGTPESAVAATPLWPFTWGWRLRWIGFPFDLLYRYGVTRTIIFGAGNLEGLTAPVIFAGTHHGFGDLPLLRYSLARTPARKLARKLLVVAAGAGAGFKSFWGRYGVLSLGTFPLEREYGRSESLRRLARLIGDGYPALYFPQGTHARPEQERANDPSVRFRPGIALLAAATNAKIVPFGLAGTDLLMPPFLEEFHGAVIAGIPVSIRRGPLAIAFGPPIVLLPGEDNDTFTSRLESICYGLTRLAEHALAAEKSGAIK